MSDPFIPCMFKPVTQVTGFGQTMNLARPASLRRVPHEAIVENAVRPAPWPWEWPRGAGARKEFGGAGKCSRAE